MRAYEAILDAVKPGALAVIDVPIGLLDDAKASPAVKGRSGDRRAEVVPVE